MMIFDALKRTVVKNADVSNAKLSLPISDIPNVKRTVIGDILEHPEQFKVELSIEGNEIVARIKPKKAEVIDVEEV